MLGLLLLQVLLLLSEGSLLALNGLLLLLVLHEGLLLHERLLLLLLNRHQYVLLYLRWELVQLLQQYLSGHHLRLTVRHQDGDVTSWRHELRLLRWLTLCVASVRRIA